MGKILGKEQLDKEKAIDEFFDMIRQSWTYARLTDTEKEKLKDWLFSERMKDCLRGTFRQRWETLQVIYHTFLLALEYNPTNWREENEEDIPLF